MEQSRTAQFRSYQGGYFRTLIAPEQTANTIALLELTLPKGAEPPEILSAPPAPPVEVLKAMQQTMLDVYKVNFDNPRIN